jgi:hypothetical protein
LIQQAAFARRAACFAHKPDRIHFREECSGAALVEERFIRKEPLRRVHECVFGVLAMETEPVDPRL